MAVTRAFGRHGNIVGGTEARNSQCPQKIIKIIQGDFLVHRVARKVEQLCQ